MIRNYNTLLRQIETLSDEMMQDLAPIDWYQTLKRYEKDNLRRIQRGVLPSQFNSPLGVQLEITYQCNLKCIHCYNYSGKRDVHGDSESKIELSDKKWISLAKELATLNIFECIISGGEPLLKTDLIFEVMNILSEQGVFFLLISNGWLMNDKVVAKLLKYKFHYVQISIDGANAETHDYIRQRKGSWEKAVQAAITIKDAGLPLCIASTLVKPSWHELSDIIDLAANIGANQIIVDKFMSTGAAALNRKELLLPEKWRKQYFETLMRKREEYRGKIQILSSMDPIIQLRLDIAGPTKVALIRPNGDVKLDCITPFVFGNINKQSLKEIWQKNVASGWQKSEVVRFVKTITSDKSLASNKKFPIPHFDKNIKLFLEG